MKSVYRCVDIPVVFWRLGRRSVGQHKSGKLDSTLLLPKLESLEEVMLNTQEVVMQKKCTRPSPRQEAREIPQDPSNKKFCLEKAHTIDATRISY